MQRLGSSVDRRHGPTKTTGLRCDEEGKVGAPKNRPRKASMLLGGLLGSVDQEPPMRGRHGWLEADGRCILKIVSDDARVFGALDRQAIRAPAADPNNQRELVGSLAAAYVWGRRGLQCDLSTPSQAPLAWGRRVSSMLQSFSTAAGSSHAGRLTRKAPPGRGRGFSHLSAGAAMAASEWMAPVTNRPEGNLFRHCCVSSYQNTS